MPSTSRDSKQTDTSNLPVDWGLPERRYNGEKLPGELDVTSVFRDLGRQCHSGRQKGGHNRLVQRQGRWNSLLQLCPHALHLLGSISQGSLLPAHFTAGDSQTTSSQGQLAWQKDNKRRKSGNSYLVVEITRIVIFLWANN